VVGEDPEPQQVEFIKLYKQEYNALPKNFEAAGYDSVNAVAAAIGKAGADTKPASVAAALRGLYRGVLARYDFSAPDMTGIDLSSYVYSKLIKGEFTRLPFKAGK
jgi:branched-chain amino acid transport system substrate-binding protein